MTTAQILSQERGRPDRLSLPQQKIANSHRWKVSHSGSHDTFILTAVEPEPVGVSHKQAQSRERSTFAADYVVYRVPAAFAVRLVHGSTEPLPFATWHQEHEFHSPAFEPNPAASFKTTTHRSLQEQLQAKEEKQNRKRLWDRLDTSFAYEDLDPDRDHPAEEILAQALFSPRSQRWLVEFSADERHPELAASLLLCLCRLPALYLVEWEEQLISRALACDDVEIRDAAVQLAAAWGGDHLQGLLQSHQEPEGWLQDYIGSVLADWSI